MVQYVKIVSSLRLSEPEDQQIVFCAFLHFLPDRESRIQLLKSNFIISHGEQMPKDNFKQYKALLLEAFELLQINRSGFDGFDHTINNFRMMLIRIISKIFQQTILQGRRVLKQYVGETL